MHFISVYKHTVYSIEMFSLGDFFTKKKPLSVLAIQFNLDGTAIYQQKIK